MKGIAIKEGTSKKTFMIDGVERTFSYFVPKKCSREANIIILAHGSYCNGEIMRPSTAYKFEERSKKTRDTIIVYPDSFGPYWNDGRLGRMHLAREMKVDELKFYKKIIDYITSVYDGSPDKVFFGGFSNGGALGFKLAGSGIFKKMAYWCINLPVSENRDYSIENELPPSIFINNTEDTTVPFDGGDFYGKDGQSRGRFYSTYDTFLKYIKEGFLPLPERNKYYNRYTMDENILIEVHRGGHTIPHPQTIWPYVLGSGSKFDSIDLVLYFFGFSNDKGKWKDS